jgi:hypothetical protein
MRYLLPIVVVGVIVSSSACGDGSSVTGADHRIRLVSTLPATDTAFALVETPLVVEIHDASGRLADGVEVRFAVTPPEDAEPQNPRYGMYVCAALEEECAWYVDDENFDIQVSAFAMTDAQGRASIRVQFGALAGDAEIKVSVPSMDIERTLEFTVTPASLAQVVALPADTAVYVGEDFVLGAYAADRFGNERGEPVTIASATPAIVGVADGTVTALAHGRARVQLEAGDVTDEAWVSVPPEGRLVTFGWSPDMTALTQLTLVNTDATDRRVVLVTHGNNGNAHPAWTPDGSRVVFELMDLELANGQLHVTDTIAGVHQPFVVGHEGFPLEIQPAFSAAEQSLYFFGTRSSPEATGIFRADPDGSDAIYLFSGVQPGPSPDGMRVAFTTGTSLAVRDLESGTTTIVDENPVLPRWSPAGDLIAFTTDNGSEVRVVRADGSGARVLATGSYGAGMSWSSDGEWVAVARWEGGIELIRVADGVRIPIPGTDDLFEPAWRP